MEGHQDGRRWMFWMVLAACATSSACTGAPQVWTSTYFDRVLASLTHPTAVESAAPARCLQAHCPCTRYKVDRQATYVRTASDPCIAQRAIPFSCGECFVSNTNNVELSLFSYRQRAIPLRCGECFVSNTNNVELSLFSYRLSPTKHGNCRKRWTRVRCGHQGHGAGVFRLATAENG